ncbi:MAG: hypothetical protein ACREJO_14820 [Phycisphaerales bacterium]
MEREPQPITINLGVAAYQRVAWPDGSSSRFFFLVAWLPPLASMLGGGWLVWSGRRGLTGVCPKCGYELAGLAGGAGSVCPECGGGAA